MLPASGSGTRAAVARVLMEQGPVTAAVVAAELELTEAAVRRHLDALIADGEAEVRAPARSARPRGRGRPAKEYLLTDAGRVRFGHGYDDLATSALRFLAEAAGDDAVDAFARRRVHDLLGTEITEVVSAGDPQDRAEVLARVLSARGYAAQTRRGGFGVQLCQHHCPVAHVAAEFPELCEAETKAFAELLGTHVQRLATIARGDAACTTHVPLEDPELRARARQGEREKVPTPRAAAPRPADWSRNVQENSALPPRAVDPQPAGWSRSVKENSVSESRAVDPQPAGWSRSVKENSAPPSRAVDPQPAAWLRKMQEEEGPAEGGTISHHGLRKGGSPYDDHS
ncbi:Iron-sulfur cluster regulator SufR [Pseudonocardia sp. Ae168_Ps1]|nr:Iron-sulfur cluster regulator SufR [Pseudonocardia sp. Ae150A_Ps1]OLL78458.1 Iron-sulfur cluster regulator SufR [Pseudonocardia sp. Ae168_Ps1]OLL87416.1 Iron-sulfur cluster regulator SufR [Pseudonocardia sp. Ae263_Ps1]OLL92555.1 Iron-sulfur cluster regulator SufR [Pseudonocardia sp. Ae356_Ps1]